MLREIGELRGKDEDLKIRTFEVFHDGAIGGDGIAF
jgi:hypothetical protein